MIQAQQLPHIAACPLPRRPNVGKNRGAKSNEILCLPESEMPDRSQVTQDCGSLSSSETHADQTRNKRSVWTVATQPYSEAHFATFPPKLIARASALSLSASEMTDRSGETKAPRQAGETATANSQRTGKRLTRSHNPARQPGSHGRQRHTRRHKHDRT